ncbi:MAG: hypothetical protein GY851_11950 [bacterium]|nr:hypothetical protein [bacterium]
MSRQFLATVCRFCPACILRRKFPESAYGRFMRRIEKGCPFCKAYDELHEDKPDVQPIP